MIFIHDAFRHGDSGSLCISYVHAFLPFKMVRQLLLSLYVLSLAAASYASDICSNYCNGTATLDWKPCQVKGYPGIECAEYQVPIDWEDCASDPITLTVNRLPSTSSTKIGSLFMRLGGPGVVSKKLNRCARGNLLTDSVVYVAQLLRYGRSTGKNHPG